MAISFVGFASAEAASVALPSILAGDVAIVFAHRTTSTTLPTLPGTYTQIAGASPAGNNGTSRQVGWRRLDGSETTTGTWTNATQVAVLVLRGVQATGTPIGGSSATGASNSTNTLQAVNGIDAGAWVVGYVGTNSSTDIRSTTYSSMTNRSAGAGSIRIHCSTMLFAAAGNFTARSQSGAGGANYKSSTIEVLAEPDPAGLRFQVVLV